MLARLRCQTSIIFLPWVFGDFFFNQPSISPDEPLPLGLEPIMVLPDGASSTEPLEAVCVYCMKQNSRKRNLLVVKRSKHSVSLEEATNR